MAERVDAELATIANGEVLAEVNLCLKTAGLRLKETGRAQTVVLQLVISKTDYPDIIEIAHKAQVKEAAPQAEKHHAYLGQDGELTVDLTVDQKDPRLSQQVIPMKERTVGTNGGE